MNADSGALTFSMPAAGKAGPNTDFQCRIDCHKGPAAANGAPNVPPAGIFDPPYTINNNNTQVNITVKVRIIFDFTCKGLK